MNFTRARAMTLLACSGLLASNLADAQARGPSRGARQRADTAVEVEHRVAGGSEQISHLGAWLQRLVGQYHIDGSVDEAVGITHANGPGIWVHRKARGAADCRRFGEGAAIHCVINVEWQPISLLGIPTRPGTAESFTMRPAILLFGIDPAASGIHVLQVDERSVAIGALGVLSGDTLQMETTCGAYVPGARCERLVRITAKPASDLIQIKIAIFGSPLFTFDLRRESLLQ